MSLMIILHFRFGGFTGEVYVCEKTKAGKRQVTVIAGVAMAGTAGLWEAVRKVCPDFIDPFLHVTLFKPEEGYGIGIHTPDDLINLCTLDDELAAQLLPRS